MELIRHASFCGALAISGVMNFGIATGVEMPSVADLPPTFLQHVAAEADTLEGVGETVQSGTQAHSDYKEPEILRDPSVLPFAARRMHELLIEAAKSGEVEKLREFMGTGDDITMLTLGGLDGDPVEFLKSMSGDGDGYEILAILEEVLEAGFIHLEAGTENEIYVWPYFYGIPLDRLDARQRVELYKLMTHGDYEDMKSFGAYAFYRVGITPAGRWRFFVAGD